MADHIDAGEVDYADVPPFPKLPEIDPQDNLNDPTPEGVNAGIVDRKCAKGLVIREPRGERH
jgi:hypothetical protein